MSPHRPDSNLYIRFICTHRPRFIAIHQSIYLPILHYGSPKDLPSESDPKVQCRWSDINGWNNVPHHHHREVWFFNRIKILSVRFLEFLIGCFRSWTNSYFEDWTHEQTWMNSLWWVNYHIVMLLIICIVRWIGSSVSNVRVHFLKKGRKRFSKRLKLPLSLQSLSLRDFIIKMSTQSWTMELTMKERRLRIGFEKETGGGQEKSKKFDLNENERTKRRRRRSLRRF